MTSPESDDRTPEIDPEELLAGAAKAIEAEEEKELRKAADVNRERVRVLEEGRERLLLVLEIARRLGRVGRVEDLLQKILSAALEISRADRAYLLREDEDGTLRILASESKVGVNDHEEDLGDISQTILEQVLERGQTLYVSDALQDPDFMAQRSVRELSLRTVVAVPLSGPGGVQGALYVDSQSAAGLLEEEGVEILEAFGAQAAVALETAAHRERLEKAAEALEAENQNLKQVLGERTRFQVILGKSPAMQPVFQVLERVVDSSVTVLIHGETGTGKELVAQALHFNGPRREANFIPVNCGAIPEHLLESELFGYKKGAFTGAEQDRQGLVESASGGTLFLDEIGELPLALQVKLLRVLQEGEIRRIGENDPRKVDVRFVSATHKDLAKEVEKGSFREDLYYRINVVAVDLPPLRERDEDILLLADQFLGEQREKKNRPDLSFGPDVRRWLVSQPWPGNVRQLQNAVERAVTLAEGNRIQVRDFRPKDAGAAAPRVDRSGSLKEILNRTEEAVILSALEEADGVIAEAARRLGISRQHLHTRIRRLGLREKM